MPNPTLLSLIAAFIVAILAFSIAAIIRKAGRRSPSILLADGTETEDPPLTVPPPITPGVPVWPYVPLDFVMIGFILLVFGGLSITSATAKTELSDYSVAALVGSIIMQFTLAGVTMIFVMWRIRPVEWLGLRWRNWTGETKAFWIILATPALTGMLIGFMALLQIAGYMKWMESLGVEVTQDAVKILQSSPDWSILGLMAFAAVIVAPICEEIIFRGYLFPFAKRYAGTWVAIFASGLIFSAAHGSLAALLPLFLVGCTLAWVYDFTKSLWAPIALHFCFNAFTVGMQFLARAYPHLLEQAK